MRVKLTCVTPLLAAGAAAVSVFAAPTAAAAPMPIPRICLQSYAGTTCQSGGNVEITNSAPAVSFYPYGTMPYVLGGR